MAEKAGRDRREYYQDYYLANQDRLSQKRKDRYKADPEYRERAKESARRYRQKIAKERERLRADGKLPPSTRQRGPRKPVIVSVNGSRVPAYTITIVAQRVGRSKDTLNNWFKAGILPPTPLRSGRGDRLYTDAMIMVLQMAIQRRGEVSTCDTSFKTEIIDGWEKTGLVM